MALVGVAIAAFIVAPYATPLYMYYWSNENVPYEPKHKKPLQEGELDEAEESKEEETPRPWWSFSIFEDSSTGAVVASTLSLGAARTAEPSKLVAKNPILAANETQKLSAEEIILIRKRSDPGFGYPREQGSQIEAKPIGRLEDTCNDTM